MPKIFAYLFLLLSALPASSQYIFKSLLKKDGLAAKEATCLYQDKEGFLWIGTAQGLNRYDGSRLKTYNKAHNNLTGLTDERITAITETATGELAIATQKDFVLFNKAKDSAMAVRFLDEKKRSVISPTVTALVKTPAQLWVSTDKGLFVLRGTTAVPAATVFGKAALLNQRYCYKHACVADTFRNGLWIGTDKGLVFLNEATGEVTSVHNSNVALFDSGAVTSLALDAQHNLWISGQKHPLANYRFERQAFTEVNFFDPLKKFPVLRPSYALTVDPQNNLWIASDYYKIFVLTNEGRRVVLPDQSPQTYKAAYGFYWQAMADRAGNFWLATPFGVSWLSANNPLQNVYDVASESFDTFGRPTAINNFKKGVDGKWWIAKYDGLYSLDESSGVLEHFSFSKAPLQNRFFDLAWIGNEWWCATGDGIQIFNPVTKTFRPFARYRLCTQGKAAVTWLFQDERKNLWFACWSDGIYRYNPATATCKKFTDTVGVINSLCYFASRDGKLWFSFGEKGLRQYDAAADRLIEPECNKAPQLRNTAVFMLTEDKGGSLYAATRNGIVRIVDGIRTQAAYGTAQGLPSNVVTNVFADPSDNLWTVYDDEVFCKKAGAASFSSFKVETGMPYIFDDWSQFKTDGKNLYVSLIQKLAVIDFWKPSAAAAQTVAPLISNVSVFEKDVPFDVNVPIMLRPSENFLTIDFSLPPGHSAADYAYKLVGYDADWVYCGQRQSAVYTRLPDGDYTFLVKASTQKNQWNGAVSRLRFSIAAPFYKTFWFLSLAAVALAFLLFWLYRFRRRRQRQKQMDATIDYFANSLYGENSVTEICWDIARNCMAQLKLEDCVVYLRDDKRDVLVQKAAYGPKNPKEHEISNPIEIALGEGIVGTAAVTGKPVLVKDTTKDGRYIVDDTKRSSELAVPIVHEGKAIGVIDSEHSRKSFFTENHLKVLSTIAAISATKIAEAKAEEAARESELQLLEIKKLLAESQLMALRAQMNPHFVFNCLNSIQECIVTQKYGEASLYLNKFAKLFRSVLNNSGKVLVTLAEEIEVLDLYLTLEHMRFEGSFDYSISTDEDLETDEILVPSMLLQPYVENALWHGLMHKESDRKLCLSFAKKSEDVFLCVVDDNGIGRKRAAELKAQQNKTKRHVSRGMTISQDRVDLLQKQGHHAVLRIMDKKADSGEATGTRVEIELSSYMEQ